MIRRALGSPFVRAAAAAMLVAGSAAVWHAPASASLATLLSHPRETQEERPRHPDEGPEKGSFSVNGPIVAVDYAANTVVVRAKDSDVSISLTPTTMVERAGEVVSVGELRPGRRVHVTGFVRDGSWIAVSVAIR